MKHFTLLVSFFLVSLVNAQQTEFLDKNNVRLLATATNQLFNDPANFTPGYEIPKGSGANAIYTGAFWFGALDANGQLMVSAQTYGGQYTDFYPGPFSTTNDYTDPSYQSQFIPAMWKVTRDEIDAHNAEFAANGSVQNPSTAILNWPAEGDVSLGTAAYLAPFVDVDMNGQYDPYAGDYPDVKGCEALYIIMNDNAGPSAGSGTDSLRIEVHIMLYQYASTDFLNDVTFMDARVINRSTSVLHDFASAFYVDADLGGYSDDYYGCDSTRNVIYTYNGDNYDQNNSGSIGYGSNTPVIGIMYLNYPMTHAGYYTNGAPPATSDPNNGVAFWNYMHGLWADGQPWVYGGTGYPGSPGSTGQPANYLFPGNPNDTNGWAWSEINTDSAGSSNASGDRRMFMTSEQGSLQPGQVFDIHMAVVYGRDTSLTNYENINVMLAVADSTQAFYNSGNDDCNDPFANTDDLIPVDFGIYPNPSTGSFVISLENAASFDVEIANALGQIVYTSKKEKVYAEVQLNEPSGIYFVTIGTNDHYITKKLLIE